MGRLRSETLKEILDTHPSHSEIDVFIETGTLAGSETIYASQVFNVVHSIELNDHWFNVSKKNTEDYSNIHLIHGDSAVELPKILEEYKNAPVFIYLDAHYCRIFPSLEKAKFPLWSELETIKNRRINDIVVVDDVHTFGRHRPDLKKNQDVVEWENVTVDNLTAFFGDNLKEGRIVKDGFVLWLEFK